MSETVFRLHWLRTTIHTDSKTALSLWSEYFEEIFGPMVSTGHGGIGFREVRTALLATKLYLIPSGHGEYVSLELPGQACEIINPHVIQQFMMHLENFFEYSVTRIDIAWDHVPFTPEDVYHAIFNEDIRSLTRRSKLKKHESPFEIRENGEIGSSGVEFGSRQSKRFLRVYDKHGPVRLELETKEKRATAIARSVFTKKPELWGEIAIGHLRDFIDIDRPWWKEFVSNKPRAWETIGSAREKELAKIYSYLETQAGPSLSVIYDVVGPAAVEFIIEQGRKNRGDRYNALLELGKNEQS